MSTKLSFRKFSDELFTELHALSAESKRRSSEVRHASDKSIEILKTVHEFEDLPRHPDFVTPFVLSCASKNAKLTSVSVQCLQKMSSVNCIPEDRIEDVLDAFIDSTHLAAEIQLKVLQIIPLFFKTYSQVVVGKLCSKLLLCCSSLIQIPNKAPVVFGTASATLQQLINDILERATIDQESRTCKVAVNNIEFIEVGSFRHDANRLFNDLCNLKNASYSPKDCILNVESIPEDYGLEVLESVLRNHRKLFAACPDLQFVLRTRAVPLLLRSISSSKSFPIVVRSARCLTLLIQEEFLAILELELEIILFLLINILSNEIESPIWKKIISLELFQLVCKNFALVWGIFKSYDVHPDRRQILKSLLSTLKGILSQKEYHEYLKVLHVLTRGDTPIVSQEYSVAKIPFIDLLDKASAPLVDQTYVVYLVLAVTNSISDGMGSQAVSLYQKQAKEEEVKSLKLMYSELFDDLFFIHKMFLYASTLDTPLFHSVVRAFQKLSHSAGVLECENKLNKCLRLFGIATVESCHIMGEAPEDNESDRSLTTASTVINTISESLIGNSSNAKGSFEANLQHSRAIHQRTISVFRALMSLSLSLGSVFSSDSWKEVLKTWQWMSYYLEGPSRDSDHSTHGFKTAQNPRASSSDISAAKFSIIKLYESTQHYSSSSFNVMVSSVIQQSKECAELITSNYAPEGHSPVDGSKMLNTCIFNRDFFIAQLRELSQINIWRLVNESKWRPSWDLVISYLVEVAASREIANEKLRLSAVDVFNNIISRAAIVSSDPEIPQKTDTEAAQSRLLTALMQMINSIMSLKRTRDDVRNGAVETEYDILFQVLRTLKGLLDIFGDSLQGAWDVVFKIINCPFVIMSESSITELSDHEEDSSILETISSKHNGVIKLSFEVFKLIFDDFLQTLPLDVVKNVIDTLLNFVRQDRDLNISFSSISQFWLIGDYLRTCVSKVPSEFTDSQKLAFAKKIEDGQLISMISDQNTEPCGLYYGLWLYLLKKLVECTNDERVEVKNGAIQTFFRIIDSHSSSFPPWELIVHEVIKPLLQQRSNFEEYLESGEYVNLTLKGLIHMFALYLAKFSHTSDFTEAWSLLVCYMADLVILPSFEISFIVLSNLRELLQAVLKIQDFPARITSEIYQRWCGYNVIYADPAKSSELKRKTNYDCVEELLLCYPFLHQLMGSQGLLDAEKVENILLILNSAARYPLLPEFSTDNQKPSTLQNAVLKSIKTFELGQQLDVELLMLDQISTIMALPFDTRTRIQMKLGPKLSSSSRKRIPSFEAMSYEACSCFSQRLSGINDLNQSFVSSKRLLKILKSLSIPIINKSLIKGDMNNSAVLWTLSSRCFFSLAEKILDVFHYEEVDHIPEEVRDAFFDMFVEVAVVPLKRLDSETDLLTEIDDIEEFQHFREKLLQQLNLESLKAKHLKKFVSSVWSASFFHEVDDIEDEIIKSSESLEEVAQKLAVFPFDEVLESTRGQKLLSKYKTATLCLQDLTNYMMFEGPGFDKLRAVCLPFLVARYAFSLRRYVSDAILLNRAPIAKDRSMEVALVLSGLRKVLDYISKAKGKVACDKAIRDLQVLYPLILRAIPVSQKVSGLETIVQEVSLDFTKLLH
ncbi:Mon2p [Lachancea thermotolerans CBS 6340]|uniref:KLTH0A01342p n=1 Tax=Lachancea thermotolerans (strain ATCC 56472 / CBS 6340 / NRRL Y-8284) TaxID=559295 RepID=C5DBC2_LACTC|nr:KLTH0A01342p [Lachancea thermotolerans CBS 6340]CAR21079.1 KLTH0A01342p [Lachancea thermotolerans CBS 6340]